jgi:hypothetical protein
MKQIGLIVLFLALTSLAQSENKGQEMQQSHALQFMVKLFDIVQKVSPKQKQDTKKFEDEMQALMKKVVKLDREYHHAKMRGLKGENTVKSIKKESRVIAAQALDKTEKYLALLSVSIKREKEKIINELMSEEK